MKKKQPKKEPKNWFQLVQTIALLCAITAQIVTTLHTMGWV